MLLSAESATRTPSTKVKGLFTAARAYLATLAQSLRPPPRLNVAEWAEKYRYVSAESGSPFPGKWENSRAPYLVEVMEVLSPSDPSTEVTVKKSAQTGFSETAINLVGFTIDHAPAPILYVLSSLDEASKFNKTKLQPSIDATPVMLSKLAPTKSRDEEGSTGGFKRFRGGFMVLTGANSSKGLQMISAKVAICDEITEFPSESGERGDPLDQIKIRQLAYDELGYKRYLLSTTGIKASSGASGGCRITEKYDLSDQRRFYVQCPQCGIYHVLHWENMHWRSDTVPHGAYMTCPANGCIIEHYHKKRMVEQGRWIKTYPGADCPPATFDPDQLDRYRARTSGGRQPGFHIWQAYSPFAAWNTAVAAWIEAQGNPRKLKVFVQQVLGEAWEERGEAPEWERLYQNRDDYRFGTIPRGGLVITAGCDVQKDGIYFQVVAWGAGQTSWVIDAGFLPGDPADPDNAVWTKLGTVYGTTYVDCVGNRHPIEALAVDSGYLSNQVYHWVSGRAKAYAVDGRDGWRTPPIGTPSKVQVNLKGKKLRRGVQLWPVGTWSLKAELYANLRKEGPRDGAELEPPGFCHFGIDLDEEFFQQLTAEYLKDKDIRGRIMRVWEASGPNHQHDCRVYAAAMAEHLGISKLSPDDWARLAAKRNAPPAGGADLVAMMTNLIPISEAKPSPPEPPPKPMPPQDAQAGGRTRRRLA